jgi:WhiB family redox-sensing transcriptional regulator
MTGDLLVLLAEMPRFRFPARCAETDPEAFFPEQGVRIRKVRGVCNRCEALDECLTYALDRELDNDWDGVWGGTSPEQRRRNKRARAKEVA